jgi:hypothetical protein
LSQRACSLQAATIQGLNRETSVLLRPTETLNHTSKAEIRIVLRICNNREPRKATSRNQAARDTANLFVVSWMHRKSYRSATHCN